MLDAMPDLEVLLVGKESSRNFFGKSLFLVIRIANGHFQHGLLESLELGLGVSPNEKSDPFFKSDGCKSWYIWSLVVLLLDQMMLTSKISIHAGNGSMLVVEDKLPRIQFMGQLHIFIVFGHLIRRDDEAISWLVVFNL